MRVCFVWCVRVRGFEFFACGTGVEPRVSWHWLLDLASSRIRSLARAASLLTPTFDRPAAAGAVRQSPAAPEFIGVPPPPRLRDESLTLFARNIAKTVTEASLAACFEGVREVAPRLARKKLWSESKRGAAIRLRIARVMLVTLHVIASLTHSLSLPLLGPSMSQGERRQQGFRLH